MRTHQTWLSLALCKSCMFKLVLFVTDSGNDTKKIIKESPKNKLPSLHRSTQPHSVTLCLTQIIMGQSISSFTETVALCSARHAWKRHRDKQRQFRKAFIFAEYKNEPLVFLAAERCRACTNTQTLIRNTGTLSLCPTNSTGTQTQVDLYHASAMDEGTHCNLRPSLRQQMNTL